MRLNSFSKSWRIFNTASNIECGHCLQKQRKRKYAPFFHLAHREIWLANAKAVREFTTGKYQ